MNANTAMICGNCRVITVLSDGQWVHPQELRAKFSNVVCGSPEPARSPKERELRHGRGDAPRSDKFSLHGELTQLQLPAGEAVALATNGSYKVNQACGYFDGVSWGYLVTSGQYGLGTAVMPAAMIGAKPGVHAELRAIWRGMRRVLPEHPVLLVSNSTKALDMVDAWRAGQRPMPAGYDVRPRPSGRTATLVELADMMRDNAARVQTMWVEAGSGMAINEGAHSLARIAQAWASKRLGKDDVITDAGRVARRALAPAVAA